MKDYTKGLVSVIMPTYKRSNTLIRAINSVLNQTYLNIELLVVNDNEPDDEYTVELLNIVACYENNKKFNFVMQDKHINGAVARNIGIKQAKGEYIAFLDDDDWWEPGKIEMQVNVLSKLSYEWGGVSCKFQFVNQTGLLIGKSLKYRDGNIYKDILNLQSDVTTCSLLLRHSCLDEAGYFDETLLRHQDLQLLTEFTYRFKLMEVDEYLYNLDVSDAQNRPDGNKLIEHKRKFFLSVNKVMDSLTDSEKRCVYAIHDFEIGYVFFKSGDLWRGIKYCSSVLKSPHAFFMTIKKIFIKVCSLSAK